MKRTTLTRTQRCNIDHIDGGRHCRSSDGPAGVGPRARRDQRDPPENLTVWRSGSVDLNVAEYGAHLVLALADSRGGPLTLPVTWDEMWQGRFGYLPDTPDLARSGSWRADYELPSVGERQSRDEGRYFSRGVPLVLAAWRLGQAGVRDVTPTDWEAALTFSADYRLTLSIAYEVLA